ncbi:hypothetical protein OZX73_00520 [Bifidobacterium sp. ESL0775]|nr:hypothetical protein [Bifidobacterium sp. ESL0775]WEV69418.1 hypothetical protein OZX73_00520 [Bifidobacterium sp. ESL0775]
MGNNPRRANAAKPSQMRRDPTRGANDANARRQGRNHAGES